MNRCMESEIRESLPGLLHGNLAVAERARIAAHVAECGECREELEILRTVKDAAAFAPSIDIDRIVRQIPPYQTIAPEVERPARPRLVSWLVAASLAVVIAGGGSVLMMQGPSLAPRSVATTPVPAGATHTHLLALAAGVEGLSDGILVQLMDEMDRFDALPAAEPEPILSVDNVDDIYQELR